MTREQGSQETDERLSRRTFTKAVGAGAGGLALGAGATGSAAARQEKSGTYETLDVSGGDFKLQVNPWGSLKHDEPWDQTIWTESDGSYGYEWGPEGSTEYPNFPQTLVGGRPWEPTTDIAELPQRRGDITEFEAIFDTTQAIDGQNYNFMCEWWLSESEPPNGGDSDYEIMLVLDWGDDFGHGMYEEAVYTDKYGNTVDWWERNLSGGTAADFHQFALRSGTTSGTVDLRRLMDFVEARLDVSDDLYLSGLEMGNEVYAGVSGRTTFSQFDLTVNGTTYTSGPEGGTGPVPDQTPYNGPHTLPGHVPAEDFDTGGEGIAYSDGTNESITGAYRPDETVDIAECNEGGHNVGWVEPGEWWEYTVEVETAGTHEFEVRVASDSGGGGCTIETDGHRVSTTFRETGGWGSWKTVSVGELDLDAGTSVVRIESDAGGWNWSWFQATQRDALVVNDFDTWSAEENDLGNWTGAGDFENGSGSVVDGALHLDYNDAGWLATTVDRDISAYSELVLSVRGERGDETDHITLDWGDGYANLSDLTDDAIGTTVSDVTVPFADIGVDTASPGQLTLNFWNQADSEVYFEEIRLA